MTKKANAGRYARAVFEIARERGELERWQSDLAKIVSLKTDVALSTWLGNPKASLELKTVYLTQRLSGVNPLGLKLAQLLISKGRLNTVDDIADEYQRLLARHRGLETARVTTAVLLSDAEKQNLAARLSAVTGKKVGLETKVDPTILGGVIARINDQLLDGSTRSRLEALKKEIASGR